jgi:DNA-binding phage protein
MIEERLLDTKRNLEKLADETGMSLEEILKLLSEGN